MTPFPHLTYRKSSLTSGRQASANSKLIAIGIDDGHIAQPLNALVWWLLHRNALLLQFRVPGIYVGNVKMDKAPNRAIIFMFGQKKSQPIPRDLHEHWEMLFEAVLPIDLEAKPVNVKSLASSVASDSQSGHNPLQPSFSTAHFCPQNPANSCGEQGYKPL